MAAEWGMTPRNVDKRVQEAQVQAQVDSWRDRRGGILSGRLMKTGGFLLALTGGTLLASALAFAPVVTAPAALTALGYMAAAGAVGLEIGGPLTVIGAIRENWHASRKPA